MCSTFRMNEKTSTAGDRFQIAGRYLSSVQCCRHEHTGRARRTQRFNIGTVTHAAGRIDAPGTCACNKAGDPAEIRPFSAADAPQRHHDHALAAPLPTLL